MREMRLNQRTRTKNRRGPDASPVVNKDKVLSTIVREAKENKKIQREKKKGVRKIEKQKSVTLAEPVEGAPSAKEILYHNRSPQARAFSEVRFPLGNKQQTRHLQAHPGEVNVIIGKKWSVSEKFTDLQKVANPEIPPLSPQSHSEATQ